MTRWTSSIVTVRSLTNTVRPFRRSSFAFGGFAGSSLVKTTVQPSACGTASKAVRGGNNSAHVSRPLSSATSFTMGLSHQDAPNSIPKAGQRTDTKPPDEIGGQAWKTRFLGGHRTNPSDFRPPLTQGRRVQVCPALGGPFNRESPGCVIARCAYGKPPWRFSDGPARPIPSRSRRRTAANL